VLSVAYTPALVQTRCAASYAGYNVFFCIVYGLAFYSMSLSSHYINFGIFMFGQEMFWF
jgi:hypothetical protein